MKPFSQKQPRDAPQSANFAPRNSRFVGIQRFRLRNDPSALRPDKFYSGLRTRWISLIAALHRSVYLRKIPCYDPMSSPANNSQSDPTKSEFNSRNLHD